MSDITSIEATFKNGDKLILSLVPSTFAGYKPATLYELTYGEKIEDPVDWQNKGSTGSYFNAIQTEYFPETEFGKALSAFNKRLTCSNPKHESDMGWDLNKILERT